MMRQIHRDKSQRQLFEEEVSAVPVQIQLPFRVQEQLAEVLRRWMRALAKRIHEEVGNAK